MFVCCIVFQCFVCLCVLMSFACFQNVLALRDALLAKCRTHIKLGDSAPYGSILGSLVERRDAVEPKRIHKQKQEVAKLLKAILVGIYDRLEAHAIKKYDGIAQMLYSELSGQACIGVLKRLDTKCLSYVKSEPRQHVALQRGSGGGARGGSRGRGGRGRLPFKMDFSKVKCYNCFEMGHYRSHCPLEQQPDAPK